MVVNYVVVVMIACTFNLIDSYCYSIVDFVLLNCFYFMHSDSGNLLDAFVLLG